MRTKHKSDTPYACLQHNRKLTPEQHAQVIREVLASGAGYRMRVRGCSMAPTIQDLDVVTIEPLAGKQPRDGDILLFLQPQTKRMVMHRARKRQHNGWLTKGDNCLTEDGIIPDECILGQVTGIHKPTKWRKILCKTTGFSIP